MDRIYGVQDVASAWSVSEQRVRELISRKRVTPDFYWTNAHGVMRYYWRNIPERTGQA